jgi:nicotinamide-nucleotide amidase
MIAEIIAAGSEMLTPYRQDTNSLYLTERLNELGVAVAFKTIVGDNLEHLTSAARIAIARADVVIFSGGLGPTEDDLTREAVGAALDLRLRRDNDLLAAMYKRFAARRMAMPPNNAKQADRLDTAEILENANGSAPGQYIDTVVGRHRKIVILLPGPPKELKGMYEAECRPRLAATLPPRHMAKRMLRMALIPESQVDARTAPIYKQFSDVETTILAGSGEIQLHFVCSKHTEAEAQSRVDLLAEKIEAEMGEAIFSSHGESLEETVLLMLGLRHMTLAAAESCTGGLLAQRLTAIPGSSRYFLGGAVVYADRLKTTFAEVPEELVRTKGPVSSQVARAMAEGIRRQTGASVGVGITGIAGPGPGAPGPDANKPIGLVYVAISFEGESKTKVAELNLTGDRERIRLWASQHALEQLRRSLLERT